MYGLVGNLSYLVQNIAKIVFNIFKVEMLTPFDHKGTDFYKYSVLLAQNLVSLLELDKENVKLTQGDNSVFFELALSRQALAQTQRSQNPNDAQSLHYLLDMTLTKDFWFIQKNLDVMTIANVVAYCLQVST